MVERDSQTYESLLLDPDESGHMALIPESIQARLDLADDGARLTLNVVKEVGTQYPLGSPSFFVLRSLIRVANFTRLSAIGLKLGYYAGAASQVRMAYESLIYTFLFNLYPDEAVSWLRTTLDEQMDKETSISEERRLRSLAKHAFNEWTDERDLGQEIWERASALMHHTAEGLAAEAGLEPRELMSEELAKALETTEGDFDSAIKLTGLLARFGGGRVDSRSNKGTGLDLPWTEEFGGLFDEEWLDYWSMILLYLVHRMTDFAYQTFPPSDKATKEGYEDWHQTVKTGG